MAVIEENSSVQLPYRSAFPSKDGTYLVEQRYRDPTQQVYSNPGETYMPPVSATATEVQPVGGRIGNIKPTTEIVREQARNALSGAGVAVRPTPMVSMNERYQDANAAAMGPVYQGSGTLGQNALPMNTFNGNPFGAPTPLGATYSGSGLGPAIGATSPYFQGNAGISFAPLGGYSMPTREPEPGTKGWYAQLGPGQLALVNLMDKISRMSATSNGTELYTDDQGVTRRRVRGLGDAQAQLAGLTDAGNALGQLRGQQLPYQSNLAQTDAINRGNELDYMASLADVDQRGRQSQDVYNLGMAALVPRQMQAQAELATATRPSTMNPQTFDYGKFKNVPLSYLGNSALMDDLQARSLALETAGGYGLGGENEKLTDERKRKLVGDSFRNP